MKPFPRLRIFTLVTLAWLLLAAGGCISRTNSSGIRAANFVSIFPDEGVPKGWRVSAWADVKDPAPAGAVWKVENGVLQGSTPRGTWLISEKQYGNFILDYEFLLGDQGNSGCGIRFPSAGDPAFDGLEIQMVDPRYYPKPEEIPNSEMTGSLYRGVAPTQQAYRPNAWNHYLIMADGSRITAELNGIKVLDVNLDDHTAGVTRHNGGSAVPLKDRPRRGHIGFQELSRGGGHVQIRNARIAELK